MSTDVDPTPSLTAAPREPELREPAAPGDVVLDSLRAFRAEEIRRDQAMVLLAVEWVRLNPAEELTDPRDRLAMDHRTPMEEMWEELAYRGCPHVDALTIPAFAEAAGLSEFQASKLVRESILLVYLLPSVWERASRGQIDVWRARKLADESWGLTPEALAYIDRNMSLTAARHTQKGREAIIAEAKLRFMPEVVEEEEEEAKEYRGAELGWEELGHTGVVGFGAGLELPDALDLEAALSAGAEALKLLDPEAPLAVRRSWALGDLARGAVFHPECACQNGSATERTAGRPVPQVKMYIHLTPEAFAPSRAPASGSPPVRVEGPGIPGRFVFTPEIVRGWLTRPSVLPGPRVTIRPVVDLAEEQHVDAYEVPDRMKEHLALRDGCCVFPWCTRKAVRSDCDHTIPWKDDGTGGPTCTCNLAVLCRRHHRAKTHADNHIGSRYTWWNYEQLGDGRYLWRGPNGSLLLRTNSGVYDVSPGHITNGPKVPCDMLPPTTLADVTSPDSRVSGRTAENIAAAGQTVAGIMRTIPAPEDFAGRYPPARGEKRFFLTRRERERERERAEHKDFFGSSTGPPPF